MTANVANKFRMDPPANWQATIDNIRRVRAKYPAPVDTMGCDQTYDRKDRDINQRFQVLTSLMLSSQTKDPITWAASQKLKDAGLGDVRGILAANEKDIEDLIHPVGFFRRKAVYLKKVAEILARDYNYDIPDNIKDLCSLPGVGPKMAHLCMLEAWNVVSGIGVDTHVHRIAGRLGWVPPKGIKTPEDTRQALESWLPRDYWREVNHMLVGFGQTICTPLRPKCGECYNNVICPSASKRGTVKEEPIVEKIKEEPKEMIDTNQKGSVQNNNDSNNNNDDDEHDNTNKTKQTSGPAVNRKKERTKKTPGASNRLDKKIKLEPEMEGETRIKAESIEQIDTIGEAAVDKVKRSTRSSSRAGIEATRDVDRRHKRPI